MKIIIVFFIILITNVYSFSQDAICASGGSMSNASGSASFTIGQVVYISENNSNGSVCQGVQQSYQITTAGIMLVDVDFCFSVFPNPTTKQITLEVTRFENQTLNYVLEDAEGKLIQSNKIFNNHTDIDMSSLPVSTYILQVFKENIKVQSFKILKVN